MNEKLFQYIWQYRYYHADGLCTTDGSPVQVVYPGDANTDQGPDFSQARIIIGHTLWAGPVELHLRTSDWHRHRHSEDRHYEKIILHVVWEHDSGQLPNGVPVLELKGRVSGLMLEHHSRWMSGRIAVPCSTWGHPLPDHVWNIWKDRLLQERLQSKWVQINGQLEQTSLHWEEVCWRMVCRYTGGPVNGESFEQIAVSLPQTLLAKHKLQLHQLEALLLGQAGLLHHRFKDAYAQLLYREYQFLQAKYGLQVITKPPSFLRMRPGNFPGVRLAQLAMLIHLRSRLFSVILNTQDLAEVRACFDVSAGTYWDSHYRFDEESSPSPKKMGRQAIDNILMNAVVPILYAYGRYMGQPEQVQKALQWLRELPPEKNAAVGPLAELGAGVRHAGDSQALLHLRKNYCDAKRCLECFIGHQLLNTGNMPDIQAQ